MEVFSSRIITRIRATSVVAHNPILGILEKYSIVSLLTSAAVCTRSAAVRAHWHSASYNFAHVSVLWLEKLHIAALTAIYALDTICYSPIS